LADTVETRPCPTCVTYQIWSLFIKPYWRKQGVHFFFGGGVRWASAAWDGGATWPQRNTPLAHVCYHTEFGRSVKPYWH